MIFKGKKMPEEDFEILTNLVETKALDGKVARNAIQTLSEKITKEPNKETEKMIEKKISFSKNETPINKAQKYLDNILKKEGKEWQ